MKRLLIFISFLSICFSSFCQIQELWSTAQFGGKFGNGAVFKVDSAGRNLESIHNFESFNGLMPKNTKLLDLNDGFLYGTTAGSIFKIDKKNKKLIHLTDIAYPAGGMTLTSDGRLIGLDDSPGNGVIRDGLIYEYHLLENRYDTLLKLPSISFEGQLVETSSGKFIAYGYSTSLGIIFEYDLVANTTRILRSFFQRTKSGGSFSKAKNGKFYGMFGNLLVYDALRDTIITKSGNYGFSNNEFVELDNNWLYITKGSTLSRYNYVTEIEEILFQFSTQESGGIMQASNNKIYGTHSNEIYEYDILLDSMQIKKSFSANSDPRKMNSFFTELESGELISFSERGGKNNVGTMFSYNFLTDSAKVINNFNYPGDGAEPYLLCSHSNGNIYGVTHVGGENDAGVLFEIEKNSSRFRKIYDVDFGEINPEIVSLSELNDSTILIVSSKTANQPDSLSGIYKFCLSSKNLEKLYTFNSAEGLLPSGELISLDNRIYYGLTYKGGIYDKGTIFKYNVNSGFMHVMHHFDSSKSNTIFSGVSFYNDSILIGSSGAAGNSGDGFLFEFNLNSQIFSSLYTFGSSTSNPISPLTIKGNTIYGVTNDYYNAPSGALFSFDYTSKSFNQLYTFYHGAWGKDNANGGVYINSNNLIIGSYKGGGFNQGIRLNTAVYSYSSQSNSIVKTVEGSSFIGDISDINSGFIPVRVCRPSIINSINKDSLLVCENVNISDSVVLNARLNQAENWKFYNYNGELLLNSTDARFNFSPTQSGYYYIESEGGCPQQHVKDSLYISVRPDSAFFFYDTLTVCTNSEYITSNGDTVNRITKNTLFSDINLSILGCDSNIYTLVSVIPNIAILDSSGYLISDQMGAAYQWIDCSNNERIMGANKRVFGASKRGAYSVEVSINGCVAKSLCLTADAVSLPENSFQSQLNYYPNPTNGLVQIDFKQVQQNVAVEVYSIQGKLVQTQQFNNGERFELNLDQPAGIYFIQLTNEKGERANLKVVKQ